MPDHILEVNDLRVSFDTFAGEVQAVRGVSFNLNKGETLGVVGESGCGKSVTMQSIMKLLAMPPARIKSGTIIYEGEDITRYTDRQMRRFRGSEMSMIFQDPMTSLNPTMRIGKQITEGILAHELLTSTAAKDRAVEMMRLVGIPNPDLNILRYPHTYSGGMRQRIMIAIAMACNPKILFADEPTTGLDLTMQAQILELMNQMKAETETSIVLITHDLGVIARVAQRILVMYAGEIIETGTAQDIFYAPQHPYTWGLLGSIPDINADETRALYSIPGNPPDLFSPPPGCAFAARCEYCMSVCKKLAPPPSEIAPGHSASCWLLDPRAPRIEPPTIKHHQDAGVQVITPSAAPPRRAAHSLADQPILQVKNLKKHFAMSRGKVLRAVDDVTFDIYKGRTLGLVGESGCGKTTVGRTILRLYDADGGEVLFDGQNVHQAPRREYRNLTKRMQVVFQDPYASLNPRFTVRDIIGEGLKIHKQCSSKAELNERVNELLEMVGLNQEHAGRFPHEFSGGQRQRVGIARALATNPDFIVCDEAISALDVSIQAQIINLLIKLQDDLGLAYLFIAHNLSVVRYISDTTAVMYMGQLVEIGKSQDLYAQPLHPYTKGLLSSLLTTDPDYERAREKIIMKGEVSIPIGEPVGCRFCSRCELATARCKAETPQLQAMGDDRMAACHHI